MCIRRSLGRLRTVLLAAFAVTALGVAGAAGSITARAAETASGDTPSLSAAASQSAVSTCKGAAPRFNLDTNVNRDSYLTATDKGYMRVYHAGENLYVEYLDSSMNTTSYKTIPLELPVWGGFYDGTDAYYVAVGQNNKACIDGTEVVRIIKYDKSWKRLGAGSIYAQEDDPDSWVGWEYQIRYPFHLGSCRFTEYNGKLYFATGREGYVDDSLGLDKGHQGMMLISMDETSFKTVVEEGDFWHSFAQFIESDSSGLYLLELSEGSRGTTLDGTVVFPYGGHRTSAWAVAYYASVDGLALGKDNILGIGTSIDQAQYDNLKATTPHNIYLTVTSKSPQTGEATTVKWLTDHQNDGNTFTGLHLTKINDDRFLVTWGESQKTYDAQQMVDDDLLSIFELHYLFIDQNGNKLTKEFVRKAAISECEPIVKNGKAVFYASTGTMVDYYFIDTQTGAFSKKLCRAVTPNAQWTLEGNTLTVSGTGVLETDRRAYYLASLSGVTGSNYHWFNDPWELIAPKVEKVVIEEGITGIGDVFFKSFSAMTSVKLPDSLVSIGNEVFPTGYFGSQMTELTIPKNVKTLGRLNLRKLFWLENLTVAADNPYFVVEDGILYNKKKTKLIELTSYFSGPLKVPASIKELPLDMLNSGSMITDFEVDANNTVYSSLNGVLYNHDKTELLLYPGRKFTDVKLAGTVRKIADNAFSNTYITDVTLPDSVEEIGENAFMSCSRLKTLKVGKKLRTIGDYAFCGCDHLEAVSFPASLRTLGNDVFYDCTKLSKITFSEGLKTVGDYCFCGVGVTRFELPSTLTAIGKGAFNACSQCSEITIPASNKYFTSIDGVLYDKEVSELLCWPMKKAGSLTVPGSVKIIPSYTGSGRSSVVGITLLNGVTAISTGSFRGCENLESVYIPASVTAIGTNCFDNCPKLTIYGEKNSAAETFAAENNIPFSTKGVPMKNLTELPRYALFGSTIQVNCVACGGSGEYRYAVYYRRVGTTAWTAAQKFKNNRLVSFKPNYCSTYEVSVRIKDSKGTEKKKVFTLTMYRKLKNTSTLSKEKIYTGESITVNCSSTGGAGKKTYAVWYRNPNNYQWYRARNYASEPAVTFKPKQTGCYLVRINTKDERGKVVKKDYSLNVFPKLFNYSAPLWESVRQGTSVYVYTSARGGAGGYTYALYYKPSTSDKWIQLQDYGIGGYLGFVAEEKTDYNVCVYVKDSNGKIAKKKFNVAVE